MILFICLQNSGQKIRMCVGCCGEGWRGVLEMVPSLLLVFFKKINFMCMNVCLVACTPYVNLIPTKGVRGPGSVITDGFESLCGRWQLSPGPLGQ